jgi:hypothetical protein
LIEKEFIKQLLASGNFNVADIEYEPSGVRIQYVDPSSGLTRYYTPDFKVKDVYVEVKDLASLGLKPYHWMSQEEALIENRAKAQAASKMFNNYHVYVLIKGKFVRTEKFWTKKEQTRLLNI